MHRALSLLLILLALSACGGSAAPVATVAPAAPAATEAPAPTTVPTEAPTAAPQPTVAATVAPGGGVDVTDSAGRAVLLPGPVTKIVSLAPSTTEILFALGLGEYVVAVDDFSNYPPEAAALPKIGAFGTVNFEQIAALEPQLVLAAGITAPEQIQKIEELQIPVIVVGQSESSLASVYDDITLVGRATGTADVAQGIVDDLKARVTELSSAVAGREEVAVFWELDASDAAKPYTVGPGSFIDELITLAGGRNIFASGDNPYPQVSAEQVVAADPQVIILADAQYGMTAEQVAARPGWEGIAAVEDGKVYPIDADLTSRPGPRIAEGLAAIVKLLHPDAVQE